MEKEKIGVSLIEKLMLTIDCRVSNLLEEKIVFVNVI